MHGARVKAGLELSQPEPKASKGNETLRLVERALGLEVFQNVSGSDNQKMRNGHTQAHRRMFSLKCHLGV
eukprot:15473658-Alexandrium_andersonii.AAC.1